MINLWEIPTLLCDYGDISNFIWKAGTDLNDKNWREYQNFWNALFGNIYSTVLWQPASCSQLSGYPNKVNWLFLGQFDKAD